MAILLRFSSAGRMGWSSKGSQSLDFRSQRTIIGRVLTMDSSQFVTGNNCTDNEQQRANPLVSSLVRTPTRVAQ
ncbi:predicted protein [Plenodomus lingam JN3]|uniref:Predicted protein n=1 Tax=Leptosphaeria maculans (strain JN3 / isolate v23.1.3 / race Av1-4-5-6-7-8) TaxID=985895 RepID=E5A530_LEPMJ|nr:predicted protein [Plenodomus lingam JN3]CBX98728.1 predicted protein [Plenodomus lingam JN3]